MEIIKKPRKSSKINYTATQRKARYIGDHPYLIDTEGVYYFSTAQNSYVYRQSTDSTKADWFRVHKENIVDIENE